MKLTAAQQDRAIGAVVGTAAGDALGAGYEFGPPLEDSTVVEMKGGGTFRWAPGEWTDDTSMSVPILRALADGRDLAAEATQDGVVAEWAAWATKAADVGIQTRQVLAGLASLTAAAARESARRVHDATGRSGGNGSLMRTAPVALGYLDDGREQALADVARALSGLTHFEGDAGDACVLWCLAIRHAVRTGVVDARVGLPLLPPDRQARWSDLLDDAETRAPRDFARNGWVVEALQAAWSSITRGDGFVDVVERAVRGGRDTDTVAAIAGALAGAGRGVSGIPFRWMRVLHGWPGLRAADLSRLAVLATTSGRDDRDGWPSGKVLSYARFGDPGKPVRHPFDDGVWLGGAASLADLPPDVDAVVSLCRLGVAQVPASIAATDQYVSRLIDSEDPADNLFLDEVLFDAANAVATLRAEGKVVFLHCVQAQRRTPAVAALYVAWFRGAGYGEAWEAVAAVLPAARSNPAFRESLGRFSRGLQLP
jgi:ADP-ribosyl-[dinitrogen reductase] hydrolase